MVARVQVRTLTNDEGNTLLQQRGEAVSQLPAERLRVGRDRTDACLELGCLLGSGDLRHAAVRTRDFDASLGGLQSIPVLPRDRSAYPPPSAAVDPDLQLLRAVLEDGHEFGQEDVEDVLRLLELLKRQGEAIALEPRWQADADRGLRAHDAPRSSAVRRSRISLVSGMYSAWLAKNPRSHIALNGNGHLSHARQARMIRSYIGWRNRHAHDKLLRQVVSPKAPTIKRAKVA
jgi:hypothetical protein